MLGKHKDKGFTLLELLLSLTALALVLQAAYAWKQAAMAEAAVQRTVDGFVLIDEAAYAFHVERSRWPTSLAELRNPLEPLLPPLTSGGFDPVVNGVGGAYVLAVIPPDLGIRVTTTMQTHGQALRVQRSFPHRTQPVAPASSDVVFEQRVAPKDSTDHELLVWRDGTRTMTANLDFNGNEAVKVRRLKMQGFDADGGACAGRGITTKSDGTLMECFNLRWRPVGQASSDVECMWTGWAATGVISYVQADISIRPVKPGSWQGTVAWCDSGRITHVDVVGCGTGGRVTAGNGFLGPSSACLSGLAAPSS
ncbi:MAG: prepilin-type N-terminal cleavage/methylation domain-containing protein [Gammaproteobacteria bacterium]|nr:prepilin-type N-terminal cleavage/methylation domain-containing protein [Gammaproteobacteria bacterium]MDE0193475.1 prepilin-type N-terminal cleavage/methylation domain-containing protein [Gammaproteobacteria bacterium]